MAADLRIKRGALAGLPAGAAGEPLTTTDQIRLYVGHGAGNRLVGLLDKIGATTAPTVNDDAGDGFSPGSTWVDETNDKSYTCVDATVGAAVWKQTGGTGASPVTSVNGYTGAVTLAASDVGAQPLDSDLTAIAALATTSFGRGLLTESSASTLRTTLSLGALATLNTVGTSQIDTDSVTYARMQNVSATSRVLGRKTAGSGDPEEVTLSELLDFIGSAAQGDILYRGGSGWARLGAGTSGQFLKTLGAAANPAWADASATSLAPFPARLSLTMDTDVTTSDVTGATRLFLVPNCGDDTTLWNGTTWQDYSFAQLGKQIGTLTSGLNYDVFLFNGTDAAAAYRSHSSTNTGTGTTHTANLPSGSVAGDLLILTLYLVGSGTPTTPAGWTLYDSSIVSNTKVYVYYKAATGAGGTQAITISTTSTHASACYAIQGGAAIDLTVKNTATSGTTVTTPDTVPESGGRVLLTFGLLTSSATTWGSITGPGTQSNTASQISGTVAFYSGYEAMTAAVAGNVGTKTVTGTTATIQNASTITVVVGFGNNGPTMELTAWTNDTTRASAVSLQNGRWTKTSDKTRLLVGTIRTTATTTTEDSESKRFVFNVYNRVERRLRVVESTDQWSYSSSWRQTNASSTNKVEVLIGVAGDPLKMRGYYMCSVSSTACLVAVGVGVDSTTTNSAQLFGGVCSTSAFAQVLCFYNGTPAVGYHALNTLEYSNGASTTVWYGDAGAPTVFQSGFSGEVLA